MAKQSATTKKDFVWDPGTVSDKQLRFLHSDALFTAYGGAKGGGKSHISRVKAIGGAFSNDGIKILMMRQTYNDLEEGVIRPLLAMLDKSLYSYNGTTHLLTFANGSTIKFGHWQGKESETEYAGLEYDWIFLDEATQFTERAFSYIGGCMRGATPFPKRMYLTCNPGGVGHNWVKRLFVDRNYRTYPDDPERDEHPEHYNFIFATVDDNPWLLESSPTYKKQLADLPEDLRRAYRYGDWDAIGGNYFPEFRQGTHTIKPFVPPAHWPLYCSFDYGLDMFCCFWWVVDEDERCWAIRHFEHEKLIVTDAAAQIKNHTLPGENVAATYAPPDIWARQKDTGRTMAEIFQAEGVNIVKSDNNRVQGHMLIKNMMAPIPLKDPFVKSLFPEGEVPDRLPGLMFFNNLEKPISDIESIQSDDKNPNDCAKEPHDITHNVDAVRYFCITRKLGAEAVEEIVRHPEDEDTEEAYDEYMCGTGDGAYLI